MGEYAPVLPFANFMQATPVIPKMYWDVYSAEQRWKTMCTTLTQLIEYADALNVNIGINREDIEKLESEFEEFKESGFVDYYQEQIYKWIADNMQPIMEKAVKMVFFGINDDGNMVASIPETWDEIIFDTGYCYQKDTYGRLLLRWDVDETGIVNQTPELNNYGIERFRECANSGRYVTTDVLGEPISVIDGAVTLAYDPETLDVDENGELTTVRSAWQIEPSNDVDWLDTSAIPVWRVGLNKYSIRSAALRLVNNTAEEQTLTTMTSIANGVKLVSKEIIYTNDSGVNFYASDDGTAFYYMGENLTFVANEAKTFILVEPSFSIEQ